MLSSLSLSLSLLLLMQNLERQSTKRAFSCVRNGVKEGKRQDLQNSGCRKLEEGAIGQGCGSVSSVYNCKDQSFVSHVSKLHSYFTSFTSHHPFSESICLVNTTKWLLLCINWNSSAVICLTIAQRSSKTLAALSKIVKQLTQTQVFHNLLWEDSNWRGASCCIVNLHSLTGWLRGWPRFCIEVDKSVEAKYWVGEVQNPRS